MVIFMLNNAGFHAVKNFSMRLSILIKVLQFNSACAVDMNIHIRQT